jgi:hypothetical protein
VSSTAERSLSSLGWNNSLVACESVAAAAAVVIHGPANIDLLTVRPAKRKTISALSKVRNEDVSLS